MEALLPLALKYGPTIIGIVWPLIKASIANGTLESDLSALVAAASSLESLGDLASTIGPAPVESEAMEKASGPAHGGR